MATVAASKTISFKTPYTGASFQALTGLLMGRDGHISGGQVSDDSVVITVQPAIFLQRGLVVQSLVAAVGIPVPTAPEPWFLLAASPDDDPDSGATFTATADLGTAESSVIIASKSNGVWVNSVGVNVAAAGERDSDVGLEEDTGIADLRDAAGLITSVAGLKGLVVDPSGKRRVLPHVSSNSAQSLLVSPIRPNDQFDRNDHLVLRQIEPYSPEIKTLIGGALAPHPTATTMDSGAGVDRPSYYAKRGGAPADQWWAWGNGIDLKIQGGPAGEAFAATVLLSGGAITSTHVAGQRASDSAILLIYVDGVNLRVVSFAAATGAVVDAPVTLEALSGQISHVRAVLDHNETLHIAFEHDEGPRQQIYYTKIGVTAGAGFGVADVTPKIINGSDSGSNDTWPDLGIDRHGRVTVAHIRGTGSNEFGDLVVAAIDQNGDTVSQEIIFAAADIGVDDGAVAAYPAYPGAGATFKTFLNVRKTSVVVTPHDEVYVFTIGLSAGTDPEYILAHSPAFYAQHGFKLINVAPNLSYLGQAAGYGIVAIDAAADELGEIGLFIKIEDTGGPNTSWAQYTFATPLLKDGKLPLPIWGGEIYDGQASTDAFDDLHVDRGPLGEFVVSYMTTTSAKFWHRAPLSDNDNIVSGVSSTPGPAMRHPRDIYLGTWSVPKALSATLDGHGQRLDVFNTRSKKMNYPIVVGQNGDFQGFGSIAQAIGQANRLGGGEIVLRPGVHRALTGLSLRSGISICGEGTATIVADSAAGLLGWAGRAPFSVTVSGSVVTDTGGSGDLAAARPGDVISLDTSGLHVVSRNLGPHPGTGLPRVLVENNGVGVPVGTTATLYVSGARLENVTLELTVSAVYAMAFFYSYRPVLRNVKLEGPTTVGIAYLDSIDPLIDGLDLTKVVNTDANTSLYLDTIQGAMIRGVKLADGKGRLRIEDTAQNIHLTGCSSNGVDPSKVIYDIIGTRTTPVFMSSCEGRISGSVASLAFLLTNVGKRMRLPEGGGALELEDDNTRASVIPDLGIKLSSVTHREFDGVSKDVVTDAVNERVLVGGDTMTGALNMQNSIVVEAGNNIFTDGTSNASAIGSSGTDVDRFDVYANQLDVLGSAFILDRLFLSNPATGGFNIEIITPPLAGSYDLTLPAAAPGSTVLLQVTSAGVISFTNTVVNDITMAANQSVIVSGTGKHKRGTRVRKYPAILGDIASTPVAGVSYFQGSQLFFANANSDRFIMAIPVEEGEELNSVVGLTLNGATDTITMKVFRTSPVAGSSLSGLTTQLGATQTSANHTSVVELLTVSGLTEPITFALAHYWVEFLVTAFAVGPVVAGITVTTIIP